MNKAIWLLCFILIINWLCNYRLVQYKVEKIQQASEHIEQKIDVLVEELEQLEAIRLQMKDDELWLRARDLLKDSSIK